MIMHNQNGWKWMMSWPDKLEKVSVTWVSMYQCINIAWSTTLKVSCRMGTFVNNSYYFSSTTLSSSVHSSFRQHYILACQCYVLLECPESFLWKEYFLIFQKSEWYREFYCAYNSDEFPLDIKLIQLYLQPRRHDGAAQLVLDEQVCSTGGPWGRKDLQSRGHVGWTRL